MINVCSHQPSLFPYVGFWNKVAQCQKYIALCGVDFSFHDYQNRVMLMGAWMTLPVDRKTKNGPIKEVKILERRYLLDMADRIERSLRIRRFGYHGRLEEIIEYLRNVHSLELHFVNLMLMGLVAKELKLPYKAVIDWEKSDGSFSKTAGVVRHVNRHVTAEEYKEGFTYYAGAGALNYLEKDQLPFPVKVQKLRKDVSTESILQLIAQEPDPIDYVMSAATWEDL